MTKRVVLKLDGSISQGLKVTAEVGMEGEYPQVEFHSKLTPNPNLEEWINYWQQMYRSLDLPTRLVLKKVIYNKPIADQIQECSHWSYRFGEVFKEWLNGSDFSKLDKNLRSILNFDETIHFLIRFEDIKIAKLPWYLWDFFEMFKHAEIAFGTPTYRKRCFSQRAKSKRLQLLAILGDSSGIDVRADQTILNAFGDIDTKFLVEPQFEDLQNHLWSHEWDIVFFAGHSQTEGRKGRIRLNSHDALDIHFLKNALGKTVESGLQLFIANSCDGLGLAYELESLNIPQIIVMREPVPDQVAQKFLKSFLQEFSYGKSLYEAVRGAREKLRILENEFPCATWLPVIFQNPAEISPTWTDLGGSVHNINHVDYEEYQNQQDERLSAAKTATPTEAPQFDVDEITPIAETTLNYTDHNGNVKTDGEVVELIRSGYVGRVDYGRSFWRACLHPDTSTEAITEGKKVTVVGTIGRTSTLVVVPYGEYAPQSQHQQKSRFLSFLSNLF